MSHPIHPGLSGLIEELILDAGRSLRPDVKAALERCKEKKNSPAASAALDQILANVDVAASEGLPLCQDCGQATLFLEVGTDFDWAGSSPEASVHYGVAQGYRKGYFRQSVVVDALTGREQLAEKSVPLTHWRLVPGRGLRVQLVLKGGGSDNASRLGMLRPTVGEDEIADFVTETVRQLGPSACPPLFISVAVGGSFDYAPVLSKKGFFRSFLSSHCDPDVAALERRLLKEINLLDIGPADLGGEATAAGLVLTTAPCHMAAMPVAVNVGCNCLRTAEGSL